MEKTIRQRIQNLEFLTIEQLMKNSQDIVKKERKDIVALIAHLSELRSRDGFLEHGYNSIYTYCVDGLNLEPSQAYLRMQVAKVCKLYPEVLELLEVEGFENYS